MSYRLAVDTGGTFTDVAMIREGEGMVKVAKVTSTPDNPALAVIEGIKKILGQGGLDPARVSFLLHGTTVATNALLELKGARAALVTTRGFRDVLEIGRQARPSLYSFFAQKPPPVVPRDLRFEVRERVLYTGEVQETLREEDLQPVIQAARQENLQSVAICFLHSYRNPAHEERAREVLQENLPGLFISCSSRVLAEFREYERTSTTCINAYVMPAIRQYLADLEQRLLEEKVQVPLFIMQSNGGIITAGAAREQSARTLLSGPAGGVTAGLMLSRLTGEKNLITIDMGGTSLDTSLVFQGALRYSTENYVGGYPLKLPMIEIHTMGAGGGSLARLDAGGALKVGPESAGAVPGPAGYDRGGTRPTVTDANLVLGRLDQQGLLGGAMPVNLDRARESIKLHIAGPLGISPEEVARGIIQVVNANMVRGIRVISVEKGYDPREFALLAFGGAGPLHGAELARELGITRVIIPPYPGINSAVGMLAADIRRDYVLTRVMAEDRVDYRQVNSLFARMKEEALEELGQEGFPRHLVTFACGLDLRYARQAYELPVPLGGGGMGEGQLPQLVQAFHRQHRQAYGYSREEEKIEVVNLRLVAQGIMGPPRVQKSRPPPSYTPVSPGGRRPVYWQGGVQETPVYRRELLPVGMEFAGPAIVEQLDSTTAIPPGRKFQVDPYGNLVIWE